MSACNRDGPLSLSGVPLGGDRHVRMIYVDEAGTSDAEPVRVVAAIIVNADSQWRALANEMQRIVSERVPQEQREGLVVHGNEIYNAGKVVKRSWPFEDRLDLMKELLCLPFVYDIPIACGIVFKGSFDAITDLPKSLNHSRIEHLTAFSYCIEQSDSFLRNYLNGAESGTVVAEDVPERRAMLSKAGMAVRTHPVVLPTNGQRRNLYERTMNVDPKPVEYQIKNIIDTIHFTNKAGAPLLQLADLCAFAWRRCLARQKHGDELLYAMLGPGAKNILDDDVWFSGLSSGLFNTKAYWSAEKHKEQEDKTFALHLARQLDGLTH